MKPVTSQTSTQNLARTSAASVDHKQDSNFAALFSSLASANTQPSPPARAPQKPSQNNASQDAARSAQMKDAANDAQPAQASSKPASETSSTSAKEAKSEDDKDDSDSPAQAKSGLADAGAQLLALAQQAQNPQAGAADKDKAVADAPSDKRGPLQRAAGKTDPLAAAKAEPDAEAASGKSAAQTDFIGHIADAQALQHAKAGAVEDKLLTAPGAQDQAPLPAAPAVLANASASAQRTAEIASSAAARDQLAPRVGAAGWDRALGQKVVWMVGQGEQSASLSLNPPDLGPLQVVLTVSQSHASADFSSAQPEVRQALQDALPRLRDMLADAGISLGQANVHAGTGGDAQQTKQGSSQGSGNRQGLGGMADDQGGSTESRVAATTVRSGVGLVNTYV